VFGTVFVEVDNLPHLAKVIKAVRRVKGVTDVERREPTPQP
jgi:(p)ppGpp synthase/HD superfamily hydrolase